MENQITNWAKLQNFRRSLEIAADGLEKIFANPKMKSHVWSAEGGLPWIRLNEPMNEVRFIGVTPSEGSKSADLRLRVFLYAEHQSAIRRFLEGKKFLFEGVRLRQGKAFPLGSYDKDLAREGVSVAGYEALIALDTWSEFDAESRLQSLVSEFCEFVRAVVEGGAAYNSLPTVSLPIGEIEWAQDQAAIDSIESRTDLSASERQALVKLRIGQSNFRKRLLARWGACSVTGCTMVDHLVASHIVPWSECDTSEERWSEDNGLLLTPDLDKLFDDGLIGFDANGNIVLHADLPKGQMNHFGVDKNVRLRPGSVKRFPGIASYLARHRQRHGLGVLASKG